MTDNLASVKVDGGAAASSISGSALNGLMGSSGGSGGVPTSPWAAIGAGADMIGGLLPQPAEYSGDKGGITAGMDAAYDQISTTMMNFPPWGTIAGGAMKVAGLLNKGMKKLGAGTDGMTTVDAILGSNFLGPIGWINGWTGDTADTMSKNQEVWANAGSSYTGLANSFDDAMNKQGAKYGGFSSRQLAAANAQIHTAGRNQNILGGVVGDYQTDQEILANQSDMLNTKYINQVLGNYNQGAIHSVKKGGIMFTQDQIRRARGISFKQNFNQTPIVKFKDNIDVEMFQKGGQMTVIPEGALHAHKHNLEQEREDLKGEITHKGIPVIDNDGNQQAEIERDEVILSLDLTNSVEDLRKEYQNSESQSEKDEIALKAGRLIVEEFQTNLDDRTGLYKQIKA